jgi:hypothetical protein
LPGLGVLVSYQQWCPQSGELSPRADLPEFAVRFACDSLRAAAFVTRVAVFDTKQQYLRRTPSDALHKYKI